MTHLKMSLPAALIGLAFVPACGGGESEQATNNAVAVQETNGALPVGNTLLNEAAALEQNTAGEAAAAAPAVEAAPEPAVAARAPAPAKAAPKAEAKAQTKTTVKAETKAKTKAKAAPKAEPPEEDPHAGHDMNNMTH